jgi:hypothetical protein
VDLSRFRIANALHKTQNIAHDSIIAYSGALCKIPLKYFGGDGLRSIVEFTKLTGNKDWRLSDIGVLRDSDTLENLGFHPLI